MPQSVCITGAGRGLGFSLARAFLDKGFRVMAGALEPSPGLDALARKKPAQLTVVPLDVAAADSVSLAARAITEKTATLDVLINNAGIHPADSKVPLERIAFDVFRRVYDVNALGPLRVVQQLCPLLEKGGRKVIINMSSEAGSIGDCWRTQEYAYCMSKAALNIQTRILQNYLKPKGFKILAVHPGWMQTDMGGPDAETSPDVAAAGILSLALRDWKPDDPSFVDYRGEPLRW